MERLKEIFNYIFKRDLMTEYALVNDDNDSLSSRVYKIYVYGDDRDNFTPHFHFFDINKTFHVEISIPAIQNGNLIILNSKIKRKGIPKNRQRTWTGIEWLQKELREWLQENSNIVPNQTNYQVIVNSWNLNNPGNRLR